ncbi:cupin domain-containing protein [Kitasatospora kifunensis]|uniref:Quercetin dioxygenase-like cupin family protein n=1 Tax=Kitasatospora kifunensis TaxID=58351 RepID=A0A7W7QYT1_KITKI|nr:cupin domain-containing protein [Kitasatospora kifunensis]MBB4922100.1 quercetin dioxygenase-like cupin family protein [Kitasatospora kifunensis]
MSERQSSERQDLVEFIQVDEVEASEVVPGITRRNLPKTSLAGGWVIDFAPGTEWPQLDRHEGEERYYVLSGEVIEGERRLGPGSYVVFAPGSSHRPRTESGARMLGINIPVG